MTNSERKYLNFIGGDWVAAKSGQTIQTFNAADTREVVANVFAGGRGGGASSVSSCAKGPFPIWAAMTAVARGRILSKNLARFSEGRKELS